MGTPCTKEAFSALSISTTFTITTMTMTMTMTMTSIFIAVMTMIMTFITAAPWLAAGTAKRTPKATAASTAQVVSAVTFSRRERADRTGVVRTSNRNHATDSTSTILRSNARPSLPNRWQWSELAPLERLAPIAPLERRTACDKPVRRHR